MDGRVNLTCAEALETIERVARKGTNDAGSTSRRTPSSYGGGGGSDSIRRSDIAIPTYVLDAARGVPDGNRAVSVIQRW